MLIHICSFCGKDEDRVRVIVIGPSSNICDECTELATDICAETLINKVRTFDRSNFEVTHYTPTEPKEEQWIPLRFLTRRIGDRPPSFYVGFQRYRITADEVNKLKSHGSILQLHQPEPISRNQGLWLSPGGEIWLARTVGVLNDKDKKQVFAIQPA